MAEAFAPERLHPQLLGVLDQVAHRVVDMGTDISITPQDHTDTTLVSVLFLVVVAAIEVALPPSDAFPQFTDLLRRVDVSTYFIAIEEVGRVDVIAPILSLLNRTDVTSEVLKDRVALMLRNHPIQVIEHMLDA